MLDDRQPVVQRKGGGGGGTATGVVGIPGGETATASEQSELAKGYVANGSNFDTPDGRSVSEAQAKDESKVINSAGIYMAAYLARYDAVKTKLPPANLAKLSEQAGFLKQFKTGDVVLRQMDASDSVGLAKITKSRYSHSGIIKAEGGRVMVLDSYPNGKDPAGNPYDATTLTPFEDFFSDQHGEKIVNGLVLRAKDLNAATQAAIAKLIEKYKVEYTTFDFDFSADNAASVMYCSELVTRVLKEAAATNLPANEFDATKATMIELVSSLEGVIRYQKATGTDPTASEQQLSTLRGLLAKVDAASVKELFAPGSYERSAGFETVTGFARGAEVSGTFKVTVLDAVVPDHWDTPDPYVVLRGGLSGQTQVKSDTVKPSWGETFGGFSYAALTTASFQLRDSDVVYDDDIATVGGDIRPVDPAGQTFTLTAGPVQLRVKAAAEKPTSAADQAPRDTTPL